MKSLKTLASVLLTSACLLGATPAGAGIIVTVGKVPTSETDAKAGDPRRSTPGGEAAATTSASTPSSAVSTSAPVAKSAGNVTTSKAPGTEGVADAGSAGGSSAQPPYDPSRCAPIGGGLVYCDGDGGTGAGAGEGEGGEVALDDLGDESEFDEVQALGCAGGQAHSVWALGLLGWLYVVLRRRRSEV